MLLELPNYLVSPMPYTLQTVEAPLQDHKDQPEPMELRVRKDPLEQTAPLDHKDLWDRKDQLVDHKDPQDHKDLLDHKVPKVPKDLQEQTVKWGRKVPQDHRDHKVPQDHRDHRGYRGWMEPLGHKDPQVMTEPPDHRGLQVKTEPKVYLVLTERISCLA